VNGLSRPRFLAVLAADLVLFWAVAELGGWLGFGLFFAGILVLGWGAHFWGADSRDGANWSNEGGLNPTTRRSVEKVLVDDQIAVLERQFPRTVD